MTQVLGQWPSMETWTRWVDSRGCGLLGCFTGQGAAVRLLCGPAGQGEEVTQALNDTGLKAVATMRHGPGVKDWLWA